MVKPLALILMASLVNFSPASGETGKRFEEVEFTFSDDSTEVIFFINVSNNLRMLSSSAMLHGDGRLELLVKQVGNGIVEESHELTISMEQVESLMRTAVLGGLAEWDAASLHARQLRSRSGRPFSAPSDGPEITILLSLKTYSRADYSRSDLEKTIRVRSPGYLFEFFPEIKEFKTAEDLATWMYEMFRAT